MNADLYELSLDRARMDVPLIHAWLASSYWSPNIRKDVVANAINNSLNAGVFLRASREQVAFARVITDFATFAYLSDVFVVEHHRGHGLASHMIRALMDQPDLQTLRRWCLVTRDAHAVYQGLGFEPVTPGRWMEKRLTSEGWTDRSQS